MVTYDLKIALGHSSFEKTYESFLKYITKAEKMKLNKRVSFNKLASIGSSNSLDFGVEIGTGGHVFQIILSNSIAMIEKSFLTETRGNFFEGDIHLGLNMSRTF